MAPRPSYPLPAGHPFLGLDAWRMLSARAAASPSDPFLTWQPFDGTSGTGATASSPARPWRSRPDCTPGACSPGTG